MGELSDEEKWFASAANTGFIGQNVYLYCASLGLATGIHDRHKDKSLATWMGLKKDQHIILAQLVGYPKEQAPKTDEKRK